MGNTVTIWAALNDKPATEGLRRLTKGFADLKAAGEIIGAPIAAALRTVTDGLEQSAAKAILFQRAIAEVATVSDRAQWSIKSITETADTMSRTFGGSATDNARALYEVISAGITDSAKATETLNAAQMLAVGGLTTVKTAVDGLTTVLNAYASTGISATGVTDAMFIAIRDGKTRAEELSNSLGMIAPIASATGVSVNEMLAAIAQLTTQGIKTSQSAEYLRSALANVIKPTKDAQETAAALGVEFSVAALQTQGLAKFLENVVVKSGATQEQLGKLFGDVQGLTGVLALTNDGGAKFNEILGHMERKAGATNAAFTTMSDTVSFQMERFDSLRESIARAFGDGLVNAQAFQGGLKAINDELSQVQNTLGRKAGEATAVVGGTASYFGAHLLAGGLRVMGYESAAKGFERYGTAQNAAVRAMFNPPTVGVNADGGTFNMEQQVAAQGGFGPLIGPYDFASGEDGRPRGPGRPGGTGRGSQKPPKEAGKVRGDAGWMTVPTLDEFLASVNEDVQAAVPKLQAMMAAASRKLFGDTGAGEAREQTAKANAANFWIVSQAERAESVLTAVRDRLGSATQELGGMLDGNKDTITGKIGELATAGTDAFAGMFVGLGEQIAAGKVQFDALLGQFVGGTIKMMGIQLINMGTAALAMGLLSFIPGFQAVTGGPGLGFAAGAGAIAAGTALVAAGSALGAIGGGGASAPAVSSGGGARGSGAPRFSGGVDSVIPMPSGRDAPAPVTINVSVGVLGDRRAAANLVADLYSEAQDMGLGMRRRRGFA